MGIHQLDDAVPEDLDVRLYRPAVGGLLEGDDSIEVVLNVEPIYEVARHEVALPRQRRNVWRCPRIKGIEWHNMQDHPGPVEQGYRRVASSYLAQTVEAEITHSFRDGTRKLEGCPYLPHVHLVLPIRVAGVKPLLPLELDHVRP